MVLKLVWFNSIFKVDVYILLQAIISGLSLQYSSFKNERLIFEHKATPLLMLLLILIVLNPRTSLNTF